jgi:hypothetical protein
MEEELLSNQGAWESDTNDESGCSTVSLAVEEYCYTPLSTDRKEIRLVNLLPGQSGDPVALKMTYSALEDKPEYEALSYAWGKSRDPMQFVYVDGQTLPVTENLWNFLHDLRAVNEPRTLWVDAICINQKDNEERSTQVSMMGAIYTHASCVLAYLGSETESSRNVFESLRTTQRAGNQIPLSVPGSQILDEAFQQNLFSDILSRTYWKRTWIIQELLTAREVQVWCGKSMISWDLLAAAVATNNASSDRPWDCYKPRSPISVLNKRMNSRSYTFLELDTLRSRQRRSFALTYLLEAFEDHHCSDARDKIYAIISLAADQRMIDIIPDYSKTLEELYLEVASKLIMVHRVLTVLSMGSSRIDDQSSLPSWVPDWRLTAPYVHFSQLRTTVGEGGSNAKFHASGTSKISNTSSVDKMRLKIGGMNFDSIRFMTSPLGLGSPHGLPKFISEIMNLVNPLNPSSYFNGEDILTAVSKTLCADTDWRDMPCTEGETLWDIFDPAYDVPPADYWPEHSMDQRLEMLRKHMLARVLNISRGRRFVMTEKAFIGLAPADVIPGDLVCIFLGSTVPLIIRQVAGTSNYILVGEW